MPDWTISITNWMAAGVHLGFSISQNA
uniref:Uncharacterized protein n=1 Tax=Rhizophora mucronata TaxID=61149 RepID=A0A2P2P5P1_RHIMU